MSSHNSVLILALLLITVLFGCDKDNLEPFRSHNLSVIETQFSDCKNTIKSADRDKAYILLEAVNRNQLKVTFVNAILNCCPGEILTSASAEDNVLKVHFNESKPMCNCICLYDLECVIDDMKNREYNIEIYAGGDEPNAKFSFVFSQRLNMKFDISD